MLGASIEFVSNKGKRFRHVAGWGSGEVPNTSSYFKFKSRSEWRRL